MRKQCSAIWESVVELAEGRENREALSHVAGCAECATKLDQLKAAFALGDHRFYNAPASLVESAKALMLPQKRVFGLLRTTLAGAGTRAISEDFQMVVGSDDLQVRLMYTREGQQWRVMGRLPGEGWSVDRPGVTDEGDGRFSFDAADLASTGFELIGEEGAVVVPSAEEMLRDGTDGNR
jgi:hypothetical protein